MKDLSKFGKRWICYKCGTKFYDLNKPEPICPKCGFNQNDYIPEEVSDESEEFEQLEEIELDEEELEFIGEEEPLLDEEEEEEEDEY